MDLSSSEQDLAFRSEVRDWLAANLPKDIRDKVNNYQHLSKEDFLRWHKILAKKGWAVPHWPVEWGGTNWDITQRYIFNEEFGLAGAPNLPNFGPNMCASVLMRFGTDAQKIITCRAFARVTISGYRDTPSQVQALTSLH